MFLFRNILMYEKNLVIKKSIIPGNLVIVKTSKITSQIKVWFVWDACIKIRVAKRWKISRKFRKHSRNVRKFPGFFGIFRGFLERFRKISTPCNPNKKIKIITNNYVPIYLKYILASFYLFSSLYKKNTENDQDRHYFYNKTTLLILIRWQHC